MQQKKPDPYEWPKKTGPVMATWIFPKIGRKWMAEGVTNFLEDDTDMGVDPYQFPKTRGIITIDDLKHLHAYILRVLDSDEAKEPYQWPKTQGPVMVERHLMTWFKWLEPLVTQKITP